MSTVRPWQDSYGAWQWTSESARRTAARQSAGQRTTGVALVAPRPASALRARSSARQKRASCDGREVDAHQRARARASRGTARPARCSQLVEHRLGEAFGVDADVDPAEQPARRRREAAAVALGELDRARCAPLRAAPSPARRGGAAAPARGNGRAPARSAPGVVSVDSSLVSTSRSTSAGGAARKPTRQFGTRIFEKPET